MRNYEAMFIFKPTLEEEKLEKEIASVEKTIKTRGKGEVKYTNIGKRVLAYPIKKCTEGVYINYVFTAQTAAIAKIKEALKHKESILRFMVLTGGK